MSTVSGGGTCTVTNTYFIASSLIHTMDPTSGYFHPFLGVEFSGEIKHENAAFHPLLRVKSGGFGASSASFNRESGAKCIYPYFC